MTPTRTPLRSAADSSGRFASVAARSAPNRWRSTRSLYAQYAKLAPPVGPPTRRLTAVNALDTLRTITCLPGALAAAVVTRSHTTHHPPHIATPRQPPTGAELAAAYPAVFKGGRRRRLRRCFCQTGLGHTPGDHRGNRLQGRPTRRRAPALRLLTPGQALRRSRRRLPNERLERKPGERWKHWTQGARLGRRQGRS